MILNQYNHSDLSWCRSQVVRQGSAKPPCVGAIPTGTSNHMKAIETLPSALRENVTQESGIKGKQWLKTLPAIIEKCLKQWHLELQKSSYELSYNYVTSVRQEDGGEAILKIGYPRKELYELKVLELLNGHCTARLLHSDIDLNAMLLEKLTPGTVLKTIQKKNDEKATVIAATLINNFPVSVPRNHRFQTVADWAKDLDIPEKMKSAALPRKVLDKAKSLFLNLEQSKTSDMLLHGDLHHDNILFDEARGWLSIDPKGVVGDPAFNAARFLNNPRRLRHPKKIMERRLEILATILHEDKKRLVSWAYVDCILSACWDIQIGKDRCDFSLWCAEIFDSLM